MQYLEYKENLPRGSFDFPIEFYHLEESHPQYVMSYHWHTEYEIIRILTGSFTISLDEEEFCTTTGDVIFISSGTLHAGIPSDCVYECIVFDMDMLLNKDDITRKYIDPICNRSILIHSYLPSEDTRLHETIWNLFEAMKEKELGYPLIIKGALYEIFGTMMERNLFTPASLKTSPNHKRILQLKQALTLIEDHYASTITLEELSKASGMSPKYFCQFFQEMTHKSPIDYLNHYRIERACYQLAYSDISITELAYNCGFNNLSYFIKTFKRYKGITPLRYQKLIVLHGNN